MKMTVLNRPHKPTISVNFDNSVLIMLHYAGMKIMLVKTKKEKTWNPTVSSLFDGGDKRDRTADLLTASQALSQLSYTPEPEQSLV